MSTPYPPHQPHQPYGTPPAYGPPSDYPPQPSYGAPPPYGQPSYDQPGYGAQPAYGQPEHVRASVPPPSQGGYGGDPYPAAPQSRRRWGLPSVLALVVALLLGCGIGGYLAARPYFAEYPATLSMPDTLVGHQRSDNPQLKQAAAQAIADLRKEVDLQDAVAEFYQDPKDSAHIISLIGGTDFFGSPSSELDGAFRGASSGEVTINNVKDVDAGPLGGVARCGETTVRSVPIAVCAWADHGSLVMGMFFKRTPDEAAGLLREIRSVILSR